MNKYCAIYARQSIDKADSISIETQIERCRMEAGDVPFQIYADRGFSGKNTERPQFQAMLRSIRNGEISGVICYKLDRCSRSILDFTQLMELFQRYGVSFISCTERFDTGTPMGRAMLNICVVFAQLERETIQQRITDAYHSRCRKGYFMGGRIPFGFRLVPCLLEGKRTSRYEILENEAEILMLIYELYGQPSASLADVVLGLNQREILNPRRPDGLWVRSNLSRVIKNPIYARADQRIFDYFTDMGIIADNPREDFIGTNGCYLYHIGDETHLVLAPHEGIIPADVWLSCRKGHSKSRTTQQSAIPSSWLTGKIRCGKCGGAVITRQVHGKNEHLYRYFICSNSRSKARTCSGFKPFRADAVESVVYEAISERVTKSMSPEKMSAERLRSALTDLAITDGLPQEQLNSALQILLNRANIRGSCMPDGMKAKILGQLEKWESFSTRKKAHVAGHLLSGIELGERKLTLRWRF